MLVLTRNAGKSIIINGDTRVTILKHDDYQVKIGIEAPPDVPVDREEIHKKKMLNKD